MIYIYAIYILDNLDMAESENEGPLDKPSYTIGYGFSGGWVWF